MGNVTQYGDGGGQHALTCFHPVNALGCARFVDGPGDDMDLGALLNYGLPGALAGLAAWLAYALIKRGFRVQIEVPPKRQ